MENSFDLKYEASLQLIISETRTESDAPWASGGAAGGGGWSQAPRIVCRNCPVHQNCKFSFFLLLLFPPPKFAYRSQAAVSQEEALLEQQGPCIRQNTQAHFVLDTHLNAVAFIPFHSVLGWKGSLRSRGQSPLLQIYCALLGHCFL